MRIVQPLAKPVAGDTAFFIRKDIYASPVDLIEVAFYRKKVTDRLEIYVETTEFDAERVTQSDVDNLKDYLLFQTPAGSINPDKGIYANEIDIFGEPPDVDNNGKLFVLLIDVRDGFVEGESDTYVAGYFDPLDQSSSKGNYSDIMYIDTNPANVTDNFTLGVVAHEMQHLIHYRYDTNESTWLNEGLSELAPRLLDLPGHSFASFLHDTNRPLNNFDDSITDYAKVGLWTFYMYKRFGVDLINEVVSRPENSLTSYEISLANIGQSDLTKERILRDWFIANLVNDPDIANGRYSYGGVEIPAVTSEHFSSNFTQGNSIPLELKPAAAAYIQFYSGHNITFDMQYPVNDQFGVVAVKHFPSPEITLYQAQDGHYQFEDSDFGNTYSPVSFIPFWTSVQTGTASLALTYQAQGIGGVQETELVHDGDSISFYINLQDWTAAEKFIIPDTLSNASLSAIKFKLNDESPVKVEVYTNLSASPLAIYQNITPDAQSWTRYDLGDSILPEGTRSFYLALQSEGGLGYSATGEGAGRAFLDPGSEFRNLNEFSVDEGQNLNGDWLIRVVIESHIERPPELTLEPDSVFLWQADEYSKTIDIINKGTQPLEWELETRYPEWISFDQTAGTVKTYKLPLVVTIDRNLLEPGLWNERIGMNSNGGQDSLFLSVLEPNPQHAQTILWMPSTRFDKNKPKLSFQIFNIGPRGSNFAFTDLSPSVAVYPSSGYVDLADTLSGEAFVGINAVTTRQLNLGFFDGVDTLHFLLTYTGELTEDTGTLQVYPPVPNPYQYGHHSHVSLRFRLEYDAPTSLAIHNLKGQQVKTFTGYNERQGLQLVSWDGKDDQGEILSSGVYLIVLKQKNKIKSNKILFIK